MSDASNDDDQEYYPEFRTVRRGYDPDEVEAVLDDLYASLNDAVREADAHAARLNAARTEQQQLEVALAVAQRRISELERGPAGGSVAVANIGSRVDDILAAAAVEAAEIGRRAQAKAQALLDEAEAALVTRHAEADSYASDVRNRAETEAAGMIESAREEAARLLAEAQAAVEKLAVARDRSSVENARLVADAHTEAEIIRSEALRISDEAIHRRDVVRAQLAGVRERVSQALAGDLGYTVQREEPTPTAAEQSTNDVAVRSS